MKGLVWQVRGEYASFRPLDATSILDTTFFPPKTAIIGMIGAACGWGEDELVDYYEKIRVGIKIESFENVFSDLVKIWKIAEAKKQSKWLYIPENRVYNFEDLKKKVSPVIREIYVIVKRYLYRPRYTIYIATPYDEDLLYTIEEALKDPVYPITLGDSDSLFYPENRYFLKKVEIKKIKSRKFRCLLGRDEVYNIGGGIKIGKDTEFTLYPRQKSMLINFEKKRKNPKTKEIICFIGEIEIEKEIEAYEFEGEPIYLF